MDKEEYDAAKTQWGTSLQESQSWKQAANIAGLSISQSNAYRLWRAFRPRGEAALKDERHGHAYKLRGTVRTFLEEQCRHTPQTPGSTLQEQLRERFDLEVSLSQITRVRAALGLGRHPTSQQQEKKRQSKKSLLKPSGKKVLAASSCLLLFKKQRCSPT